MVVTCGLFLCSAGLVLAASAEPMAPPWTLAAAPGAAVQWWVSGCAPPLKLLSCAVSATARLTAQPNLTWAPATDAVPAPTRSGAQQIVVSGAKRYQQIYGIGSSLEASTDYNLHLLGPARRASLLRDLFDPNEGIGMTLARITIATSDFTPPPFYSYDDLDDPAVRLLFSLCSTGAAAPYSFPRPHTRPVRAWLCARRRMSISRTSPSSGMRRTCCLRSGRRSLPRAPPRPRTP